MEGCAGLERSFRDYVEVTIWRYVDQERLSKDQVLMENVDIKLACLHLPGRRFHPSRQSDNRLR